MLFKKSIAALVLATTAVSGLGFAAPASARDGYREYRAGDYYRGSRSHGSDRYDRDAYRGGRYDRDGYRGGVYYSGARYNGGGRYYADCRRDNGTGGTIIGAIAGGLLGNEVARGGDRYRQRGGDRTGAVIAGAVVGGLIGGAIDRSDDGCR